jgi:hypothetical protein
MSESVARRSALVASPDPTAALIKAIAMDIGKEVVHHIETMYPDAAEKLPGSGKLSVRNTVYNEIMAAIQVSDEGQIVARLQDRKAFRRKIKKMYSDIRSAP